MARKEFAGGAPATTLDGAINNSVLALTLASGTGYPTGTNPFVLCIDRGELTEEKVLCESRTGTSVTITSRGYDGTAAVEHGDNAVVEHVLDAVTIDEANKHANDGDTTAHAASKISFSPTGTIAATTVQAAIAEVSGDVTTLDGRVDDLESAETTGVLAVVAYDPSATNTAATGTIADVDATNLAITFDVPASGDVLVTLCAYAVVGGGASYDQLAWGLREGSSTIAERNVFGGILTDSCVTAQFVVTGLTPAASKTYKWAHRRTSGSGVDNTTTYGGINGPAVMTVQALP